MCTALGEKCDKNYIVDSLYTVENIWAGMGEVWQMYKHNGQGTRHGTCTHRWSYNHVTTVAHAKHYVSRRRHADVVVFHAGDIAYTGQI